MDYASRRPPPNRSHQKSCANTVAPYSTVSAIPTRNAPATHTSGHSYHASMGEQGVRVQSDRRGACEPHRFEKPEIQVYVMPEPTELVWGRVVAAFQRFLVGSHSGRNLARVSQGIAFRTACKLLLREKTVLQGFP